MERLPASDFSPIPDVPLSPEARMIFQLARDKAGLPESGKLGSAHLGTEHLLFYLAQEPTVRIILTETGIPVDPLALKLESYISEEDNNLPNTNEEGLTPTVVTTINNAKRLADRDGSRVTATHLYAGLIEAGRGKALMVLGEFLGYAEDNQEATPLIQRKLFSHIPSMRKN